MSNEELALQVQAGDTAALPTLWEQVKRLCQLMTRRYYGIAEANRAVDGDDLIQCAYLGMCRAAGAYRPDEGSFTTVLGFYVRNECRASLGLVGREREEHYKTLFLDAPISTEGDTLTLADTLQDAALPDAAERLIRQELSADIGEAVESLPVDQKGVIIDRFIVGAKINKVAAAHGMTFSKCVRTIHKGLMRLADNPKIERHRELYYRHKGVTAFFSSRTSTVEDAVLWLEELGRFSRLGARP